MLSKFPHTRAGVATLLEVSERHLLFVLYALAKSKKQYFVFEIPKKTGGTRRIEAPAPALKVLQRRFSDILYERVTIKPCAFAFVRGKDKGIKGNADKHKNKSWVVSIDLTNFFVSINFGRVRGLFLSEPFNCSDEVATVFAQLVCNDGHLAQGAPTSPIISNLICHRLDNELLAFAKKNRLMYTRYADDLTFSSYSSSFPDCIGQIVDDKLVLSKELVKIVEENNGFSINEKKVHFSNRHKRQLVTGLVVNRKVNVPRHYIRQVRAILHAWRKFGIKSAAKEHYRLYRPSTIENPEVAFSLEVQGKINYIGDIRGKEDRLYNGLCELYKELEPRSKLKVSYKASCYDAVVFCEGPSDRYHLDAAMRFFQENGKYEDLNIMWYQYKTNQHVSNSELKDLLEHNIIWKEPEIPEIYLFDRDDPDYYCMANPDGSPIAHKKGIYSMILPTVPHRKSPRVCIEHFYVNADLLKKDSKGRRIFLSTEFDREKAYCETEDVTTSQRKALSCDYEFILDNKVYDKYERNVALPKMLFAKYINKKEKPFDTMDFSHFSLIFDQIRSILKSTQKEVV